MDLSTVLIFALIGLCLLLMVRARGQAAEATAAGLALRQAQADNEQLKAQADRAQSSCDAIANTTIDPILFIDGGHIITYRNNAAHKLFGSDCAPGRSLIEVTRSYELDAIAQETLSDTYELPRELSLGGRLFRVRASALRRDGFAREAVLLLYDVGELQRLGRARRDFVANISHELRTPLTAIRLLVDTLRNENTDDGSRDRLLDQISGQVDSLTQLTQELYDLSLIESGRVPMRMVPTPLAELVDGVIARLAPQAERAGLMLANQVGRDVVALIDPEQIRRVLSNLLHNAIKFTLRGGVTVSIAQNGPPGTPAPDDDQSEDSRDADYLTVAISDTGAGIPADALPRIFERFYKVDRVRGQGGTGLGLSIAKHIVEAHGGHIWVESVEGQGATFYFTVPGEG